jgi:hypothetical protein
MKKQKLETFIKKYSLNGLIESVKFSIDSKKKELKTSAITDEKNVLGFMTFKNFDDITEDVEIGIHETSKLKQMLGVLNEEIKLSLNKNDKGIVTSLSITDDETTVQFVTADLAVIPSVPNLKKIPDFNVEIELSDDYVTKFIKATGSLPDEEVFTLMINKKDVLETTIGFNTINSNRITLSTKAVKGKEKLAKNISFNAKYFKDILTANKDCINAIYKVSDAGLSTVTFSDTDFDATYYIVETKKA